MRIHPQIPNNCFPAINKQDSTNSVIVCGVLLTLRNTDGTVFQGANLHSGWQFFEGILLPIHLETIKWLHMLTIQLSLESEQESTTPDIQLHRPQMTTQEQLQEVAVVRNCPF